MSTVQHSAPAVCHVHFRSAADSTGIVFDAAQQLECLAMPCAAAVIPVSLRITVLVHLCKHVCNPYWQFSTAALSTQLEDIAAAAQASAL
jgi:hypothetical protein